MMNVTLVVTSTIGIKNIDSECSMWVVFGNQNPTLVYKDTLHRTRAYSHYPQVL